MSLERECRQTSAPGQSSETAEKLADSGRRTAPDGSGTQQMEKQRGCLETRQHYWGGSPGKTGYWIMELHASGQRLAVARRVTPRVARRWSGDSVPRPLAGLCPAPTRELAPWTHVYLRRFASFFKRPLLVPWAHPATPGKENVPMGRLENPVS